MELIKTFRLFKLSTIIAIMVVVNILYCSPANAAKEKNLGFTLEEVKFELRGLDYIDGKSSDGIRTVFMFKEAVNNESYPVYIEVLTVDNNVRVLKLGLAIQQIKQKFPSEYLNVIRRYTEHYCNLIKRTDVNKANDSEQILDYMYNDILDVHNGVQLSSVRRYLDYHMYVQALNGNKNAINLYFVRFDEESNSK